MLLFLFPTAAVFTLFYAYPLVNVLLTSFTDWKLTQPPVFVGFRNYVDLSRDGVFIASLVNVLKWLVLSWTVYVGIGILTALMTAEETGFNRIFRVIYLIPNMISIAALAMTFYFVFQPTFGVLNSVIRAIGFPQFNKNWYFEYDSAFFAVTATTIFFAGVIMLLVSSEVSSVPSSVLESAKIDGAKRWQRNLYVVLPMIRNIIGSSLILATVQVLKVFEVIFLTTRGGPGTQTMNLSLYLYRMALTSYQFGYANAIGTVTIVIGLIAIMAINRIFRMGSSHEV